MIKNILKLLLIYLVLIPTISCNNQEEKLHDVKVLQLKYAELNSAMQNFYLSGNIKHKQEAYNAINMMQHLFDDMIIRYKKDKSFLESLTALKTNFSLLAEHVATPFLGTSFIKIPRSWYFFFNSKAGEYHQQLITLEHIVSTGQNFEFAIYGKKDFPPISEFPELKAKEDKETPYTCEGYKIIVNKSVYDTKLKKRDIKLLFAGKKDRWSTNEQIKIVILNTSEINNKLFSEIVEIPFDEYKSNITNSGRESTDIQFVDTEKELAEYVSNTDGAIGYISSEGYDKHKNENIKLISVIN